MTCRSIPAAEAAEMIGKDPSIVIVDVRTQDEYNGELGHLRGALVIPLQELQSRLGELEGLRGKEILVYCRTGRRSLVAADLLQKNGLNATNVEGGMVEWNERDLPGVEFST